MQINIQGRGMTLTGPIKEYAGKKIKKLEGFFQNMQKAEVILETRKISDLDRAQVAEVVIWAAGKKVMRATEAAKDVYAAIDLVFDELKDQIKKHKEKRVQEKRRGGAKTKMLSRLARPEQAASNGPKIVKRNNFNIPVMTAGEAKEEIKISELDFLVFQNAESAEINVAQKDELYDPSNILPLTKEDAARVLSEGRKKMVAFLNPDTSQLNVLYKRLSGNFGLIEP